MSGATVRITGLAGAIAALNLTKKQLDRMPDLVGTAIVAGVKNAFIRGADPETGTAWAPLKARHGQPLRDRGVLMRSIHYEAHGGSVSVGTNLIYAATHQFGDSNRVPKTAPRLVFKVFGVTVFAKKVSIPRRRFLPETDGGLERTAPTLRQTIEKAMAGAWK